jgi:YVTN family beta-propeller protein
MNEDNVRVMSDGRLGDREATGMNLGIWHLAPRRACAAALGLALGFLLPGPVSAQQGTLVVLNKAEATATLIDLASGRAVATLPTGDGPHEVAVSPDGRWAVASNYGGATPGHTLTVLDLARRAVARTVDLGAHTRPHGMAWTGDGRRLLVTSETGRSLVVLNAATWTVASAIATDSLPTHMLAVSPDGRRGYAASIQAGKVVMLDLERGVALGTSAAAAGSEGIAVSPDGREVWVACRAANVVAVLDAATLRLEDTLPSAAFPIRVRFTPDGRRVLVTNARSGDVRIFDARSRRAIATVAIPYDSARAVTTMLGTQFRGSALPIGVLASPDGRRVYVAASAMAEVLEVDAGSWTIVRRFSTGREPDGLGFSPITASP